MSLEAIQQTYPLAFAWISQHGTRILVILAVAIVSDIFLRALVEKKSFGVPALEGKIRKRLERASDDQKKRIDTIVNFIGGAMTSVVYAVAALMILPELGINIEPILAGILAIGIATKDILADFINGLLILVEDQYRIGDNVSVAGVAGCVKEITLRRTVIKGGDGELHIIPNREVKVVTRKIEKRG